MKPTAKTVCYQSLKRRVLTLEIAPGTALDETALSESFGLSRTPLRDVFRRLAGEGYITLETNRGASVSSMDLSIMRTFFQTAPMIYAAVARLAAENRTPDQLGSLRSTQAEFRKAVTGKSPAEAAMHNHRFHEIIGEMSANTYLVASLNRLLIDHTRMSQTFYKARATVDEKRIAKACDQHDAMIDAIKAGSPAKAVELTLAHWDLSRDQIEKYVQPDPLPVEEISPAPEKNKNAV